MRDILKEISKKIDEFCNKNHCCPTKVYLTYYEELEIGNLKAEDIGGSLASEMFVNGARKTLMRGGNTLKYLKITWDANEFKVE